MHRCTENNLDSHKRVLLVGSWAFVIVGFVFLSLIIKFVFGLVYSWIWKALDDITKCMQFDLPTEPVSHWTNKVQLYTCVEGTSWSWSHGSWIYNYLCNQSLSPLKLWARTPFMARCTRYNIMWQSLSVTCDRSVVFSRYSGFLHQLNWPPGYNWNIVASSIKHHKQTNLYWC